ncbi:MAG TPA: tetratricopeptide repeat protein [Clostridia bacterium]|nr:tetratricopeptide repeat protein [Clostridia bacterium]
MFKNVLEDLSFLQLRRDLRFGDLFLPKGLHLPLYTKQLEEKIKEGEMDFGTEEILEGILSLYGADKDFKDKELYQPFIKKLQPLLPYLYEKRTNPKKALLMALGLIHLDLEEKGLYLFAAERCNDLIKEGLDCSELAMELLEKEKPSWPVGYHKGFLYYNKERYHKALEAWGEILDKELPTEIRDEVFSMMALADKKKEYLGGRELLFKERFEEARQVFKSLLADFPNWYELHFYYGLSLRLLEQNREALTVFYGLLQTKRDDIHLYNELAICHLFLQEAEEARVLLEEGLKLEESSDLRLNLAISLFELGSKKEALEEIQKAKKLAPEDELIDHWLEHMRKE